jgi:hypothetical protein
MYFFVLFIIDLKLCQFKFQVEIRLNSECDLVVSCRVAKSPTPSRNLH